MKNKRLNILIISDFLPYPLDSGGKVCLYNFVDHLRDRHNFTLFTPSYTEGYTKQKDHFKKIWPEVQIESVDLTEAGQKFPVRLKVLKAVLRRLHLLLDKWTYTPDENYKRKLDFSSQFAAFPPKYIDALKELCKAKDFDIIQVQYTRNLNLVSILPQRAKKIFEQIESQFDVLRDYSKTKGFDDHYTDYLVSNSEIIENTYINRYDAVFTLNSKDAEYFSERLTHPKIFSSPFGVLNRDIPSEPVKSFKPKKIIFSGNENHYPNVDALEWYLKSIHSKLADENRVKLHITGNWSDQTKEHMRKLNEFIVFEGFVEDYNEFLKESIVIVPIRIGGGGLRTKILYALANGIPVVTTSVGEFGIEATHGVHLYKADNETEFANSINGLINNENAVGQMAAKGREFILEKYSQTKTAEKRNELYFQILND